MAICVLLRLPEHAIHCQDVVAIPFPGSIPQNGQQADWSGLLFSEIFWEIKNTKKEDDLPLWFA